MKSLLFAGAYLPASESNTPVVEMWWEISLSFLATSIGIQTYTEFPGQEIHCILVFSFRIIYFIGHVIMASVLLYN